MAFGRTVYFGTFVHSKSLEELDISHNTAVFVDENGRIAAIERGLPNVFAVNEVLLKLGWTGARAEHVAQVEHIEHLEHVGNGVHALENGVSNGASNGAHGSYGVTIEINGEVVKKRQDVKLVMCEGEQFFFPGFIGAYLSALTPRTFKLT